MSSGVGSNVVLRPTSHLVGGHRSRLRRQDCLLDVVSHARTVQQARRFPARGFPAVQLEARDCHQLQLPVVLGRWEGCAKNVQRK